MPEDVDTADATNYATFLDCLSSIVIAQLATPIAEPKKKRQHKVRRKTAIKPVGYEKHKSAADVGAGDGQTASDEDLTDFIEYLAADIFPSFPEELRCISYAAIKKDSILAAKYEAPIPASTLENIAGSLPPTTLDSLTSYGMLRNQSSVVEKTSSDDIFHLINDFLKPLLTAYITTATAPPPATQPLTSRATTSSCEICGRDWLPLTYHHLIPRAVHAKVLKRGWHEEWQLNSVAWLCRACHNFVHGVASNEELAREWYSVELLCEREDVRRWAGWVGKVRWKAR